MGVLQPGDLTIGDAVEDVGDGALGQRRGAVAGVPVVNQGRDKGGIKRDRTQQLAGDAGDRHVAILGDEARLIDSPLRGIAAGARVAWREGAGSASISHAGASASSVSAG